jgi:hypothetical protein
MTNDVDHGKLTPGEPIEMDWTERDWRMICCDCGLTHRFHFVVIGERIIIQGWRDVKYTKKMRKNDKKLPMKKVRK